MNKKLRLLICFALIVTISIPVISIALAGKPDKGPIEKKVFIHYKKGYGKPEGSPGKGPNKDNGGDDEEGYYTFLAKGVKWKELSIEYVINPTNLDGLTREFIVSAITDSVNVWESSTTAGLFGSYTIDYVATWDSETPDGRNELVFGDYPQDGVIAVCIVWGYFGGPPGRREIIEFDILFDIDYTWGDAGDTDEEILGNLDIMDLQNIATHEIGHGLGLGDLYDSSASEETMYGYSGYGETKKRTLYFGDIAGIQALYGE